MGNEGTSANEGIEGEASGGTGGTDGIEIEGIAGCVVIGESVRIERPPRIDRNAAAIPPGAECRHRVIRRLPETIHARGRGR